MAEPPPPIPLDPERARRRRRTPDDDPAPDAGAPAGALAKVAAAVRRQVGGAGGTDGGHAPVNGTRGNGANGRDGNGVSAPAAEALVAPAAATRPRRPARAANGNGARTTALRANGAGTVAPPAPATLRPAGDEPGGPGGGRPPRRPAPSGGGTPGGGTPGQIRVRRLRIALILAGLGVLAMISTVFGMMMAVAGELPSLENEAQYARAQNSTMYAANERVEIAKLTGNQNRILLREGEISPNLQNAVVAIEDRRFYEHEGVDFRGIGRALWQDIRRAKAVQGGSTITQQFVKNALDAQGDRSVFQKLRESAAAYHIERQWPKPKVLTQYLNTIYFGNGAYGVEAAVRTYFRGGSAGFDPDRRAASDVEPHEAALLAAIIASPSAYDPVQHPKAATDRRNIVLRNMLDQGFITQEQYAEGIQQAVPTEEDVEPPKPNSREPYFSTWVTQQLVDRHGPGQVFGGGLEVKTTLDTELQAAAEAAVSQRLPIGGPTASLVAIENKTGAVKAMVGGSNFDERPFNLATNGQRQPGSAIKPFTLIAALEKGVSPARTFSSRLKMYDVPRSKGEKFVVRNYEGSYAGVTSLAAATAKSDNSVYAELGYKIVGTKRIAKLAAEMGVRTPVSTNPAMTLGGLEQGLTPLELTYAYSTIANRGERRSGTLAASDFGPVAIESIEGGGIDEQNKTLKRRVYPKEVGETARTLLRGVVTSGTGTKASLGGMEFAAGKTGTTENYGDAWFCGFNDEMTICVWVGYPDKLTFMKTEYRGQPVAGGTFPAEIWRAIMLEWIKLREARDPDDDDPIPGQAPPSGPAGGAPAPSAPQQAPQQAPQPQQQAPQPAPQREPAPQPAPRPKKQPAPPPSSDDDGGGGSAPSGAG